MTEGLSLPLHYYVVGIVSLFIIGCTFFLYITAKQKKEELTHDTTGHVWDDDLTELNTPLPRWWLTLFYLCILFTCLYLLLYPGLGNFAGVLGWSHNSAYETQLTQQQQRIATTLSAYEGQPVAALLKEPKAVAIGKNIFLQQCAGCHGSDAGGATGFPNLTDHDWLYGSDPDNIVQSIALGRNGMMPPFGAALDKEKQQQLALYLISLSRPNDKALTANAALVTQGATLYAQNCAACHGPSATGNPFLGAPNLSDNIWLYGGSVATIMETIDKGRQGRMPAHQEILSELKIMLVASYVKSLTAQP